MDITQQSLMSLFKGIDERLEVPGMPTTCLYEVAEKIVAWTHRENLAEFDSRLVKMLQQIMQIVSNGLTGNTHDANTSVRTLKATLAVFTPSLSRR